MVAGIDSQNSCFHIHVHNHVHVRTEPLVKCVGSQIGLQHSNHGRTFRVRDGVKDLVHLVRMACVTSAYQSSAQPIKKRHSM